jgi:hypothetical protein
MVEGEKLTTRFSPGTTPAGPAVEEHGLAKAYGEHRALDGRQRR